jgi:transcriptional regulator of acetoin/glycerol metabolism
MVDTDRATDTSGPIATHDMQRPHLVLMLERGRPLAGGARYSLATIDRVTIGRGASRAARRVMDKGRPTLQILVPDERISLHHAFIDRNAQTWRLVDCESTNGSKVNRRRTQCVVLSDGDILELGRTLFRYRAAMPTPVDAAGDLDAEALQGLAKSFGTLLPWLARDLDTLARVARSDVAVLLLGETGTGKEVLARAIHEHSGRTGPFVAINCGALPATLLESLLFGHKKGAFSGAVQDELGFVRAAQGGTLFLDEVGDLPEPSQAALLRVLQEREVTPVGATRPIEVDARVVAATHRALEGLVHSGEFREDLLARLSAFTYRVPPLRDRIDDIGVLVAALLGPMVAEREATKSWSFSAQAAYALIEHSWPHNARELEQRLKVGALLASGGRIELAKVTPGPEPLGAAKPPARRTPVTVDEVDQALREAPTLSAAAQMLRIHRSHLYRLIRHFGIDVREGPANTD